MVSNSYILTYHSVDRTDSVISIAPEQFRAHMELLRGAKRSIVALAEVQQESDAVAITFDDGFRNFYEEAFPILCEWRMPATVFVVAGHCGGRNDWPSQATGCVPDLPLMSWNEIQEIARHGVSIGAHSMTHPYLTALAPEVALKQMRDSRLAIEDRIGQAVTSFAYPYGNLNAQVRQCASQEFSLACSTELNFLMSGSDPLSLPRLDAYYFRQRSTFELLHQPKGKVYVHTRRIMRDVKARLTSLTS